MTIPALRPKCKVCREPVAGVRWQVTDPYGLYGVVCGSCHGWLEETEYARCERCGRIRHETWIDRDLHTGRTTCRDDAPLTCAEPSRWPRVDQHVPAAEAACEICCAYVPDWCLTCTGERHRCDYCLTIEKVRSAAEVDYSMPDECQRFVSAERIWEIFLDYEEKIEPTAQAVALEGVDRHMLFWESQEDNPYGPSDTCREVYG